MVSCYHFFKQGNDHEWQVEDEREIKKMKQFKDFNDFVFDLKKNKDWWVQKFHFLNQHEWTHSSGGELCLGYLGRVETIDEDIKTICEKISIPTVKIKKLNKSNRNHYSDYYSKKSIEVVSNIYAKDIEYFGYKFGE
ncbi:MAG: hypothetical protein ACI9FD_003626 [Gammaproteobacteria bacterium]